MNTVHEQNRRKNDNTVDQINFNHDSIFVNLSKKMADLDELKHSALKNSSGENFSCKLPILNNSQQTESEALTNVNANPN